MLVKRLQIISFHIVPKLTCKLENYSILLYSYSSSLPAGDYLRSYMLSVYLMTRLHKFGPNWAMVSLCAFRTMAFLFTSLITCSVSFSTQILLKFNLHLPCFTIGGHSKDLFNVWCSAGIGVERVKLSQGGHWPSCLRKRMKVIFGKLYLINL